MDFIIKYQDYLKTYPDKEGFFNLFGGSFTSSGIKKSLDEVNLAFEYFIHDNLFLKEIEEINKSFIGRPTPLYKCTKVKTNSLYLKREDLNYTGSHKLNHCMGQLLLAKKMNKKKIICETGAGQHGVAVSTACKYFDLKCEVHIGYNDYLKQSINVSKMKLLGADIVVVNEGNKSLKEAVDSAFKSYEFNHKDTFYCMGSVVGPSPYPKIVRYFQLVIGNEAREQILNFENKDPDYIIASVGGGSNAIGIFIPFIDTKCTLFGVEPFGNVKNHASAISFGKEKVIHGFNSLVIEDTPYSIASGLDYPSVGPEHAFLNQMNRVQYVKATDKEAIEAFYRLINEEGIIPALESAHALSYAYKLIESLENKVIIVNLSGRGDKDIDFLNSNISSI